MRQVLQALAPTQRTWDLKTMRDALNTMWGLLPFEGGAWLATFLGAIALALSVIGVCGTVSTTRNGGRVSSASDSHSMRLPPQSFATYSAQAAASSPSHW